MVPLEGSFILAKPAMRPRMHFRALRPPMFFGASLPGMIFPAQRPAAESNSYHYGSYKSRPPLTVHEHGPVRRKDLRSDPEQELFRMTK